MAAEIIYATGRRKSSIARVWIVTGQKGFVINGQDSSKYLKRANLQMVVDQPINAVKPTEQIRIRARVQGGGISGQAGAVRLGISRALCKLNQRFQPTLRKGGFLTRDPRQKERKKYGKKGARRGFQFTKR